MKGTAGSARIHPSLPIVSATSPRAVAQAGFNSVGFLPLSTKVLFSRAIFSVLQRLAIAQVSKPVYPESLRGCVADFQVGWVRALSQLAGLETRDTADLQVCATLAAASPRQVIREAIAGSCLG